jgi:tetratricopeptide (TPR) repeat protein
VRIRGALAAASLIATAATSCKQAEKSPPAAPPELSVEPSGCRSARVGPVCEVAAGRPVRLWIKAAEGAEVAIMIDGKPAPASVADVSVQGGRRAAIDLPEAARELSVIASKGGGQASFRLALEPKTANALLEEAEALRQRGELDNAKARLEGALKDPRASVRVRAQATGKLARVERGKGNTEEAIRLFHEALRLDREGGLLSDEFSDRFALAYTLIYYGRRFSDARAALEPLDALAASYPEGRAIAPYYRGLVAYETGDLRTALRLFRESAEGAERLGLDDHRVDVLQPSAGVLSSLGRSAEAEELLREAKERLPKGASPCRRAHLLNDIGWLALRASASSGGAPARGTDPLPPLEEAYAIYRDVCREPADVCNVLTNLALAELDRGRPAEAQRYLKEARRADRRPDARIEAWWLILEGRIALGGGEAREALTWYDRLDTIGASALLPDARFEAALGRAQALDALGRTEKAREAYAAAEGLLDELSLLVPLGEGRETFLARHEQSTRRRVDFLLREARREDRRGGPRALAARREAAAAARKGRARILSALQRIDRVGALSPAERAVWESALASYRRERAALDEKAAGDWQLPGDRLAEATRERASEHARLRAALDQALASLPSGPSSRAAAGATVRPEDALPEPEDGEVLLVYHPVVEGWAGFAITRGDVLERHLGAIDRDAPPPRLAEQLLLPFRDAIAGAKRIRLAAFGPFDRVDFQALPWEGRPLLAHAPILYGLDLPRRSVRPRDAPLPKAAVVVADPRGDLPAARGEASRVAGALEHAFEPPPRVTRLEGPSATHDAVRRALELPGATLFHYAGHGVFQGRDGWESGLPLAEGGWLTVGDVMALAATPPLVVLSGCDTARTTDTAPAAGLGLAQAFIVAGASVVIAAARPVNDKLAAAMMGSLYEAQREQAARDLASFDAPEALRRAQLAAMVELPDGDWASFRALVP